MEQHKIDQLTQLTSLIMDSFTEFDLKDIVFMWGGVDDEGNVITGSSIDIDNEHQALRVFAKGVSDLTEAFNDEDSFNEYEWY